MKTTAILFTKDLSNYVNIEEDCRSTIMSDLGKVNFLIGPNNSGKSRMMRSLFYGECETTVTSSKTEIFQSEAEKLLNIMRSYKVSSVKDLNQELFELYAAGIIMESNKNAIGPKKDLRNNATLAKVSFEISMRFEERPINERNTRINFAKPWNEIIHNIPGNFDLGTNGLTTNNRGGIYIPILRGTRTFDGSGGEDSYLSRTKKDYFNDINDGLIFTGYNIFSEVRKLLLGRLVDRKLIRDYEKFLSDNFFHQEVTLIPQEGEDLLLVKIGKEDEKLIYDLGDGVQSIIVLTFPIFIRKGKEQTFYIEEPELNLHPSLQRKLLQCLVQFFPKHQFFLTTHSNHFLEAITEYEGVSLFSFRKSQVDQKFHVRPLNSMNTEILDDLGVRNSSVLLANCTIWIEGITDRLYIRKFLELFMNHQKNRKSKFYQLKEEQHYSFVEYGGSNIVHWDFGDDASENIRASVISNRILLIADSDHNEKGNIPKAKKDRFEKLEEALGKNFIRLNEKEIENILTRDVVLKVVQTYEKNDGLKIKENPGVLETVNVGRWIEESIEGVKRNYISGNTISDKLGFCRKAINSMNSIEDLSESAIELCKRIHSFAADINSDYL